MFAKITSIIVNCGGGQEVEIGDKIVTNYELLITNYEIYI